ncbi:SLAP domain-containing protein [Lactobacillus sp. ESL0225]|uniref:SLAP domain-containing protein n=1 Tax=Lactobacillus sp. ESL0225 TaxID=2069351 RepID=UPI000EFAEA7C|nr:SLAP domain-containing protein [Lactobacillus sp. ESL0225]RMC48088.1 amidase [Lactobacillus sp. ESL0225]
MKIKKLITTIAIGVGLVIPIFKINQNQVVEAATVNSIAKQNSYSNVTFLYKMLQTQNIRYNKFYANGNKIKYRKGKPEGIVIHETATPGASAYNEAIYFNREWKNMYSYVHAFVDHDQVIQMMTPNYGVWGAGAIANNRYIQIELCQENTRAKFAKSVNNDAIYAAKLLHRYNIKPSNACNTGKGTVWSHHAVSRFLGGTNHTDPDDYFARWGYSMDQFYALLKYYYNLQGAEPSPNPKNDRTDNPSINESETTGTKTLMHDSYIYDANGELTSAPLMLAGTQVTLSGSKTINGKPYLKIDDNQYVDASNIIGTKRTLKQDAYIYDTAGVLMNEPELKCDQAVKVYGSPINIAGEFYYPINANQFVKVTNFK